MDEPSTSLGAQIGEPNTGIVDTISEELKIMIERVRPISSTSCIYRVPSRLRSVNKEAYTPKSFSIGPIHHNTNESLQMMEESKLRLVKYFIRRTELEFNDCVKIVTDKEEILRDYYHERFALTNVDFLKIILVDDVFIVELFLTLYSRKLRLPYDKEHRLDVRFLFREVKRDLLLLENQVPFFILEDFWKLVNPKEDIKHIFYSFFNRQLSYNLKASNDFDKLSTPKHLVDLLRNLYIPLEPKSRGSAKSFHVPSATDLHLAGVKLTVMESSHSLCDVRFSRGTLEIPKLMISDNTEVVFMNLIAFEQCHFHEDEYYMSHYVTLMDFLINISRDVDLLVKKKIVENWMGDSNYVSEMINKLGVGVSISDKDFYFAEIFNGLNDHCEITCNKWMANLKQKYFNTPWAIISLCGAVFLIILTLIQAVCAIIPLGKK